MIGWIVFIAGVIDLVWRAYIRAGIWICVPIAICWYIMIIISAARAKKEKFERKILLERLRERVSAPTACFFFV